MARSILSRIFRRPAGDLQVPTLLAGDFTPPDDGSLLRRPKVEAAELGDRTYADAALDAQLRRFMHAEYDSASPSPDSFQRLLARANLDTRQPEHSAAGREAQAPRRRIAEVSLASFFRRAVSSRSLARVAPSAVALLLVLAVLGANISDIVRGNDHRFGGSTVSLTVNEAGLRYGDSSLDEREIEFMKRSESLPDYAASSLQSPPAAEPPDSIAPPRRDYYALQGTGPVPQVQPKTSEWRKE